MFSLSLQLRRAAAINQNGVGVYYEDRSYTWAEILDQVQRFAGALKGLGLDDGDRVAILANNCDRYYEYYFAVPWAGGIAVPINARLAPDEIVYWLNDSKARFLFVEQQFCDVIDEIKHRFETVEHVIVIDGGADGGAEPTLEDLIGEADPVEDAGRCDDDIAIIFYTSGTTGISKGVALNHKGLVANSLQWAVATGVTGEDLLLIAAPMFHLAAGLNVIAAVVLAAGSCIVPRFEASKVLSAIETFGITKAALVSVMVDLLIQEPDFDSYDLSSLKRITYGGAPMPDTTLTNALEKLRHVDFYQVYGQTESGGTVTTLAPRYHVTEGPESEKRTSAGQPVPGIELVIQDEDGNTVPEGAVGEICLRSPAMTPGYWQKPEQTAESIRDGWLHTGDAGYLDKDGFLYIVDRVKDMIVSGGENIYPAEVENVLYAHPEVVECAVIGIPSERWVEQVHAIVRLKEGFVATEQDLIDFCRKRLATYKCMRSVEIRREPFPVNGTGKVLKRELRKPYWEKLGRDI